MMSHDCARSPFPDGGRPSAGPAAPPAVARGLRKLRFAVAFYSLPVALAAIAIALSEVGVAREQIHLVAEDETLAAASRELALKGYPLRLTEIVRCMTCQETTAGHPWVLELLAASAAADGQATQLDNLGRLAAGRHAPDSGRRTIDVPLQKGDGVVIVRLDDETSEQDICSLMLRHHSMSVQTHDLRPID